MSALSYLGFSENDTIYFGDDDDDMELLQACSIGIAVNNANQDVKEKANVICGSAEDDGVAKWRESIWKLAFELLAKSQQPVGQSFIIGLF